MTIGQARQSIADALARAELYRMWHAAQRMGATHAHSLEMMGAREGSPTVELLRTRLLAGTQRRATLTAILKHHADLVKPFEGALLAAGEESGGLEQALETLASHYRDEHRLLLKIWSKLTYPLMTSFVACLIAPLPILVAGNTRGYITTALVSAVLWYMFGGVVVTVIAARYANRREFVLARLARALAGGVEAGLPLDRVAVLAAESTGHPDIIAHVRAVPALQLATQSLSETFTGCAMIPHEMAAALHVAEVSGDFSGSLRKLADLYDEPK